jgi:hypothetical protein
MFLIYRVSLQGADYKAYLCHGAMVRVTSVTSDHTMAEYTRVSLSKAGVREMA